MQRPTLPPWPAQPPRHGQVVLRRFTEADVAMVIELSADPYVPQTGSLPDNATRTQARAWVQRQVRRHADGVGFSFAVADARNRRALGNIGLWCTNLADGRAIAGYAVAPSARGHRVAADALVALLSFAWTLDQLHRVELYVEEWNVASIRTAERAGFAREGLLRSHQQIGDRRRDMILFAAVRD